MIQRSAGTFGVIALLALALTLSGCGKSKKGGSYLPSTHVTHHSGQLLSTG